MRLVTSKLLFAALGASILIQPLCFAPGFAQMRQPVQQDLENQGSSQNNRSFDNSYSSPSQQYGVPASGSIADLVNKIPGANRCAQVINRNLPISGGSYGQMIPSTGGSYSQMIPAIARQLIKRTKNNAAPASDNYASPTSTNFGSPTSNNFGSPTSNNFGSSTSNNFPYPTSTSNYGAAQNAPQAQMQSAYTPSVSQDRWGLTANFPLAMPAGGDDADLFAIPNVSAKLKNPLQDVWDYYNVKPDQASELVW